MSKFEDHLWTELVREHGDVMARASRPAVKPAHRRPRLLAGTGLGVAGVGAAVALVLGTTSPSPAFAVTRNHDGSITISIKRYSGIAGANARLHELGIKATVTQQAPAGCQPTASPPTGGQGAAVESGTEGPAARASLHWRIVPSQVPVGQQLVLTPPPPPPGAGSGKLGSDGQVWSCGSEGPGAGSPPPAPNGDGHGSP